MYLYPLLYPSINSIKFVKKNKLDISNSNLEMSYKILIMHYYENYGIIFKETPQYKCLNNIKTKEICYQIIQLQDGRFI